MRLIIALTATAVVAATLTVSPLAGTHHRGWSSLTLTERRAVALRQARTEWSPIHWWLLQRSRRNPQSGPPLLYCRAIGIRAPGPICVHGQRFVNALHLIRRIEARLAARDAAARQKALVSRHYAGWMCIHSGEGAWNANTGNGYYGGLQMTAGWGGLARADLVSASVQIATAESIAADHGWSWGWMHSQWPNTFPRCAGYFV